jgi:serine/threonine-protein kinase
VGEYVIEALLGKGGFGTVYRAGHPVIGKQVAIKVLARKYAADPAVIQRFAAEARAVNQIKHRNIIDIFQFSQLADGRHYYVMECLDGEPLDQYLVKHGPMPLVEALPILKAIGRALDAAHAKGIAHRDLKPENIFLARDPDGEQFPKLLDFGIAKLLGPELDASDARFRTATGIPIGTPYYMSPEQCRGKDVDHRTDIYSFGIVAFRILTGTYPFDGDDYVELLFKQVNDEPPLATTRNPALPQYVADAIAWMMRKDPTSRPASLAEATAALAGGVPSASSLRPAVTPEAFAQTMAPVSATLPPTTLAAAKGRRPAVWIGGALVLVCSAAGAMLIIGHGAGDPSTSTSKRNGEPVAGIVAPAEHAVASAVAQPPPPPPPTSITLHIVGGPAHATATLAGHTIDVPGDLVVPISHGADKLVIDAPAYKQKIIEIHADKDQDVKVPAMDHVKRVTPPDSNQPPVDRMDIAHPSFPKGGH